jgi:bla regulator protein BlaR1
VHLLLGLSTVLTALAIGYLALHLQHRVMHWTGRRQIPFFILAVPVLSLALTAGALWHFSGLTCFLGAPPLDDAAGLAVPVGMGLIALGALALGLARLIIMQRFAAHGVDAGAELQGLADRLADGLGVPHPRVLVRLSSHPVAFTCGIFRPAIVLSTWMIEHLDPQEQESVLAHELAHALRRDYLGIWLATVLRDAFFYLPTSRAAYRQLWNEREPACDDLAAALTRRPLALASALAKVWHEAVSDGPTLLAVPNLAVPAVNLEDRIRRLIDWTPPGSDQPPRPSSLRAMLGGATLTFGGLPLVNLALVLAPMGCGPLLRMLG